MFSNLQAAEIRKDEIVLSRLRGLDKTQVSTFYYHLEGCYRNYCNQNNLDLIAERQNEEEVQNPTIEESSGGEQPDSSRGMDTRSTVISTRNPASKLSLSSLGKI